MKLLVKYGYKFEWHSDPLHCGYCMCILRNADSAFISAASRLDLDVDRHEIEEQMAFDAYWDGEAMKEDEE